MLQNRVKQPNSGVDFIGTKTLRPRLRNERGRANIDDLAREAGFR
jgi:hypothetical protein